MVIYKEIEINRCRKSFYRPHDSQYNKDWYQYLQKCIDFNAAYVEK